MQTGDKAPDFTLKDSNGDEWTLSEHEGEVIVLIFYPGDDTPVCTKQLCSVRENWDDYKATGAAVIGISTDSVESHKSFRDKYDFPFRLLSDPDGDVIAKYGVKSWIPGRSARAVVVVGKDGTIASHHVQSFSIFRPKDEDVIAAAAAAAK
ncbi:MAG TPA: peroxiredoxin [Aridibacter sp.]|nr:peroxiredoxin [Aridibacter sp.]